MSDYDRRRRLQGREPDGRMNALLPNPVDPYRGQRRDMAGMDNMNRMRGDMAGPSFAMQQQMTQPSTSSSYGGVPSLLSYDDRMPNRGPLLSNQGMGESAAARMEAAATRMGYGGMPTQGGRETMDDLRVQEIDEDRDSPIPDSQLLQNFQILLDRIIENSPSPSKQIIYLRPCILYPPPPGAAPVTIGKRPPGCKTVFVGGLPRNCTREILLDVFETCRVSNLRMDGDYAHVRFYNEADVEKAVQISGYRMKLRSRDDDNPNDMGTLHVEYARDEQDLREWEDQQRSLMRVHYGDEQDVVRPESPTQLMMHMTPEQLLDKIKSPDTFGISMDVLVRWFERGKCNQQTGPMFYNLLQSVHSQIRVIGQERNDFKREYLHARQRYRQRHQVIMRQFEQIDQVFSYATKQKVWDNFSKAQRRQLEIWRKECSEHRALLEAESLRDQWADEEDDGRPSSKRSRRDEKQEDNKKLRDENETLRCQLEAYRNEVELLKVELREAGQETGADSQLQMLQQAVQGMQEQLLKSTGQIKAESAEMLQLQLGQGSGRMSDWEARIIALSSSFLSLLPEGASVDYVLTYLQHAGVKCSNSQLTSVMEKCPSVFRRDPASIENRFRYVAFGDRD